MEPWPTTVSKVIGLYFLADTTKFSISGRAVFKTTKVQIFRVRRAFRINFSRIIARKEKPPIFVPMKMLILVPKVTERVVYVFDLMFSQLLGIEFDITTDAERFKA